MEIRGTTILAVKKDGKTVIAGDGQVTMGQSVILKGTAVKVRKIYQDKVIVGFAGSTADAFNLTEKFEKQLQKYSGNLMRAAVELAQLWRTDKILRNLDALMIVADKENLVLLTGAGDVFEPEDGICAIGSGGNYALAAAKALFQNTKFSAKEIARKAMEIASDICVFTNSNFVIEEV